jgi:hypothetical protein
MKIIQSFKGWLNESLITENISAAKGYVQKRLADKLHKQVNELTPEEREKALLDQKYREIIELVKPNPGYAFPFVKFHYEHGATLAQLRDLLTIIQTKKHLLSQLPKSIDQYVSQEEVNGIKGFEALMDALRTLDRNKEAKWIVDRLPKRIRDQYRSLPADKQTIILNSAHQLKELGEQITDRLMKKIASMSSWNIDDIIAYIENYLGGYSNLGMRSKINDIESLEPEAGIIYVDDQYLVLSARTENSQKRLCSVANWCINRGSFSSYANNAVQLNIFNFGIPPTDPMFLIGTTIYYTGKARTTHDINDTHIHKSDDPKENLRLLGYPDKVINGIMAAFDTEVAIKKLVYSLSVDSNKPIELLAKILRSDYEGARFMDDPRAVDIVSDIVANRILPNVTREELNKFYMDFGVMTLFSAKVFKDLYAGASPEDYKLIIDQTLDNFKYINNIIKTTDFAQQYASVKIVLDQEQAVLAELGVQSPELNEMLNEFVANEPAVKPAPTKTPTPTKPAPSRPSPVPTKQPFKQPEPAKADADDVIKRLEMLTNEEL